MPPMQPRALLNPGGHDFGKPNLDLLGILYITFGILYTLLVACGLYALWVHRHNEVIRLRSIALSFAAIVTLHIYLLLVLAVYPENGLFACGTEFWIMSTALPLGQALFQACNAQVFSFAERQLRLLKCESIESLPLKKNRFQLSPRGLWGAWLQLNIAHKTYVGIVFGATSTIITTAIIYFGSRMFHADFGFFGTHTTPAACRQGVEWIPSIFWQLLWTVVFGPYILYKIRNLNDVHGWAWQTRIAIICGLPGTPLWLLFTYGTSPAIAAVNKYWVPAMWFLPSLISMQTTLWLIPVWEAIQDNRRKRKEIAENISSKATTYRRPTSSSSMSTDSSSVSFSTFNNVITFSSNETLIRLQKYCAQVTMNGELIAFVRQVLDFTRKWENKAVGDEEHRQMFRDAALIYFGLVNEKYADLPVNLPFGVRKNLDKTFSGVRFSPFKEDSRTDNVVTPWDNYDDSFSTSGALDEESKTLKGDVLPVVGPNIQVPRTFNINVFKPALEVIKQDIYNSKTFHRFFEHEQTVHSNAEAVSGSKSDEKGFMYRFVLRT